MSRVRTIDQTHAYIHERDPQTALTKCALRRMVISGELPSCRAGKKYLLDLDVVERHLLGTASPVQSEAITHGTIRAVN